MNFENNFGNIYNPEDMNSFGKEILDNHINDESHNDVVNEFILEESLALERDKSRVAIIEKYMATLNLDQHDIIIDLEYVTRLIIEKIEKFKEVQGSVIVRTEERIVQDPLDKGDEWKEGTEYVPVHKESSAYYAGKTVQDEHIAEQAMLRIHEINDELKSLWGGFEEKHPKEAGLLDDSFQATLSENRTN